MNKKQAARARRRAAKPEPNMPTVDELIKIGLAKHTEKKIWNSKINSTAYKIPFEYQEIVPPTPTSNNRLKPKDPTYDHKPRKIVLE